MSLTFGETLAAVRAPVDGEKCSRLEMFGHTRRVVARCAYLPAALKEGDMLIVTTDAVLSTVCGRGVSGHPVQDVGYQRKNER